MPPQRGGILLGRTAFGHVRCEDLDPEAYLHQVLTRIADHAISRMEELLPWNIYPPLSKCPLSRFVDT